MIIATKSGILVHSVLFNIATSVGIICVISGKNVIWSTVLLDKQSAHVSQ
jgi:hypothetical protein